MDQNQNLQIARSLPRNLRLKGARTSRLRTPGAGFFSYLVPPWIRGEYVASKGKSTLTARGRSIENSRAVIRCTAGPRWFLARTGAGRVKADSPNDLPQSQQKEKQP